jgi:two-component system, NarL family, nitrate/nitrite sensor histidine kinase NarX
MDDKELLRARLATFAALLLFFSFYLYAMFPWKPWVSGLVALLTAALLTAVLDFWLRLSLRRATHTHAAAGADKGAETVRQQVQVIFELQRKFLMAHSEKEILEAVLQIGSDCLHSSGASFVPYDEWGQSLPALFQGAVPTEALQSWSQRLTSPQTRQLCKNCQALHGGANCTLVSQSLSDSAFVHCFPVRSSERELGMFNFFFEFEKELGTDERMFIAEVIRSGGQALESLRLRDREIAALRYLQTASAPKADLALLLENLLENAQKALDVDFALLYLPGGVPGQIVSAPLLLTQKRSSNLAVNSSPDLPFLDGIWKSVLASCASLSLENVTLNQREAWKGLLAVPLRWQAAPPLGVLVLGSNSSQPFVQRHQVLLETLAGQAALLIKNADLMVQVEYQAVVDERTRLAREIHDGLAQTLAFLKIQAAQMQNYLTRGETERLTNMLQSNYRTLSDAYLDARQAIENLRRLPSASLRDWVGQVAEDFVQNTGLRVDLSQFNLSLEYPLMVQAQLIRIVQEALSNIRKHAQAQHVAIRGRQIEQQILIEIQDDGIGFLPESVSGSARYGLVGMRERAEMIGADFQITSQPGQGATVSLRLPASVEEEV